jgi:chromate transporter
VEYAFRGIQVCVIYLIFSAGLKMLRSMKKTALSLTILSSVAVCMVTLSLLAVKFSTILYILICGIVGLLLYFINTVRKQREGEK